jgi:hypothetical protein
MAPRTQAPPSEPTPADEPVAEAPALAAVPAPAEGDDGESLEFRADGSVRCRIGGKDYRLRRPNVPEMFELWHAIEDTTAQQVARIEEAEDYADKVIIYQQELRAYRTRLEADASSAGTRPARPVPPSTTAATIEALTVNAAWMRKAFDMLANPTLPEEVKDPGWFASTTIAGRMLEHWRDIPLDLSGLPEAQ